MRMRVGVGPVERGDLLGLDAARGQHGVGAVDDGRLGLGPPVGHVGLDLFGHRLGLHPVQRVEGADEREVELVLDDVAREPREPVVGVDRGEGTVLVAVEAEAARRGHPVEHALGELVDHGRERLLGQDGQRVRPGTWCTRSPGSTCDHGGQVGRPGPGEDVAGHARSGQGGGQLTHVDVHAAAVPGAGLGQGRGVEGEDGEPTHGGQILPVDGVFAGPQPRDQERGRVPGRGSSDAGVQPGRARRRGSGPGPAVGRLRGR